MKNSKVLWIIVFCAFTLRILLSLYAIQYRENTDILRNKDWAKISFLYGYADTYTPEHITFGTMPNNMPPGLLYILSFFYIINIQLAKIILRILPHTPELYALFSGPLLNLMFRFPAILADCFIGIGVWLFFSKREYIRNRTLVTLLILFNPVFIFNSAFMGQMDAVNNAFFFGSLILLTYKRYGYASALLAMSLLVKMSLVYVVPFFFYILYIHSRDFRTLLKGVLSFVLTILFAVLPVNLNPVAWYINFLVVNGSGEMQNITSFAFNLWWVIFRPWIKIGEPTSLFSFSQISLVGSPEITERYLGIPLGILACLVFTISMVPILRLLWRKGRQMVRPDNLFLLLALVALMAYTTLPKMHDRYIYPSLLLLSVAAGFRPQFIKILILLTIFNLFNLYIVWHPVMIPYITYNFMNSQPVQWYISMGTVLTIVYLYWRGITSLTSV